MYRNPAVAIIYKLDNKKLSRIEKLLRDEKRKTTLDLFLLIKNDEQKKPDKKIIFKQLYGTDYTEEKDGMIRHDLRLLRQKIDGYLIDMLLEKELKNNPVFWHKMRLLTYSKFNLLDQFAEEYETSIAIANEQAANYEAIEMKLCALELASNLKLNTIDTYEKKSIFFHDMATKTLQHVQKLATIVLRKCQYYFSFAWYYKRNFTDASQAHLSFLSLNNFEMADTPVSQFYLNQAHGLVDIGLSRLNYYQQSFDVINLPHFQNNQYLNGLKISALLSIGRTEQQLGHYQKALYYLSMAIDDYLPLVENYGAEEKLYANYIVALLNEYQYETALQKLKEIHSHTNNDYYISNWFVVYRLICLIGLRQTDELNYKILTLNEIIPPQHRLYLRLCSSIKWYLLGRFDMALKEINSIIRGKQINVFGKELEPVFLLFEMAFYLLQKKREKEKIKEKDIQKLVIKESDIEKLAINDINILPLFRWLKKELNTILWVD